MIVQGWEKIDEIDTNIILPRSTSSSYVFIRNSNTKWDYWLKEKREISQFYSIVALNYLKIYWTEKNSFVNFGNNNLP